MRQEIINVLVVEDKLLIAEDIAAKLRKHGLTVAGICTSGEEAVEKALALRPDLLLMDIALAGEMDGITAAAIIKKAFDVGIVYLSDLTDPQTLDRAKKTLPENYLAKPIQEAELIRAIDFAFYSFNNRSSKASTSFDFVFLRTDNQAYIKIRLNDILYLEADRAYCKIVCKDKTYTMSTSMNHVNEQIRNPDFVKVHRSFIINVNNIAAIEGNSLRIGATEITMNKEGKDILIARLKFIK